MKEDKKDMSTATQKTITVMVGGCAKGETISYSPDSVLFP
jgi:hypothetical protein